MSNLFLVIFLLSYDVNLKKPDEEVVKYKIWLYIKIVESSFFFLPVITNVECIKIWYIHVNE